MIVKIVSVGIFLGKLHAVTVGRNRVCYVNSVILNTLWRKDEQLNKSFWLPLLSQFRLVYRKGNCLLVYLNDWVRLDCVMFRAELERAVIFQTWAKY